VARRKVATGVEGMIQQTPPRWLERMLLWCLPARDRETISGDLLEEYREEQMPHLGSMRANVWYLRQSISFLSVRSVGGSPMKASLTWISVFTAAAGVWLTVMENIQRHAGYAERSAIAACIAIQGLSTVLFLVRDGRSIFRMLVLTGAVGVMLLGASAVKQILDAPHFEGFVFLIGSALIVQGGLALAVVLLARHGKTI
jgi:hypothetical protein